MITKWEQFDFVSLMIGKYNQLINNWESSLSEVQNLDTKISTLLDLITYSIQHNISLVSSSGINTDSMDLFIESDLSFNDLDELLSTGVV